MPVARVLDNADSEKYKVGDVVWVTPFSDKRIVNRTTKRGFELLTVSRRIIVPNGNDIDLFYEFEIPRKAKKSEIMAAKLLGEI